MSDALTSFLHRHEVVVHLGAHKTATTYIQLALKAQRAALQSDGIAILLPGDLRGTGALGRSGRERSAADAQDGGDAARGPDISGLLNGLAEDPATRRIVLSEESIIGAPRANLLNMSLYPDLVRKTRRLPVAMNHPGVTFLLAVREYGGFFSSNVTTAVRRGNVFDPAALRSALLALNRSWVDVVADLRQAFPAVTLKIWRYEDFERLEPKVFDALVGGPVPGPPKRVFKTLSRDAMAYILSHADQTRQPAELRPLIRAAAQAHPISEVNPPFSLWTGDEAAHLRGLYDLHWQEIRDRFPGNILE